MRAGLQVLILGGMLLFPHNAFAQNPIVPENKVNQLMHTLEEFGEASESGDFTKAQKELDELGELYESIEKNVEVAYPEINEDIGKSIASLKSSVQKKDVQSDEFREDFEELEVNLIQLVPANNTEIYFEKKALTLNEILEKVKNGLENKDWAAVKQDIDIFSDGYETIKKEASTRNEESNKVIESKLHEINEYLSQNQPDAEKIGEYITEIQSQLAILAGKSNTRGGVAKGVLVLAALVIVLGALVVTRNKK